MEFVALTGHILEFFVDFLFFETIFQPKRRKVFAITIGLSMYVVVFLLYLIFDSTVINIVSATVFNFLFGVLFYKCKIKSSIFCSLFLNAALTASDFIVMTLISYGSNGDINSYESSVHAFLITALFSRTIYLIIILSVGILLPKDNIGKFPLFLFLFPIASTVVLYTLWIVSSEATLSNNTNYLIIASSFSVVVSILLTYIFYGKTTRELNDLYKIQSENDRAETDAAYYAILDRQNEQLKTILHDEKNHLSTIKSLANKPEVSQYIDEIYGQITENSLFGNTNNKILDLIINKYQYICRNAQVDFYVAIKTANLSHIEAPDLTTLFGNLLDNAVDAAKISKNRKIDLSLNKVNGFEVLTCTNSCDSKPTAIGNDLKTTKTDIGFHGLGMNSIKRVVKKYHGNFEWSYDEIEKEFTVYVAF